MNCCEKNGFDCRQGRDCPNNKPDYSIRASIALFGVFTVAVLVGVVSFLSEHGAYVMAELRRWFV